MNVAMVQTSRSADRTASAKPLTSDPQFWIATVIAVIAAGFLLRALLPKLGVKLSKGVSSKATLTVGGKVIKK